MSLFQQTQALLKKHLAAGSSLRQLAERSNGSVEYEWLVKFAGNHVKDPGVNRVQALHDFLASLPIPRIKSAA
jgi:hypothetical protein